jgi:hypothetical protein
VSAAPHMRLAGFAARAGEFLDESARDGDGRGLAVRQLAALQGIGYALLAVAVQLDDANDVTVQCAQDLDGIAAAVGDLYRPPLGARVPGMLERLRKGGERR